MKVAYYLDQIYLHGGIEKVLANKLNYLSENTYIELHVITFQQQNKVPCYPINNSVKFHDLGIKYNRELSYFHLKNIKYVLKHFLRLNSKIREINPDVMVVCNYEYGFYFIPLISKKAITIKEFHASGYFSNLSLKQNNSILKKIINKISVYFESKYKYLVVLTHDEINYHEPRNTIVIPNGISKISKTKADLDNKRVISAGRNAPFKGFENLIDAWQNVHREFPNWKLDIFGDGNLHYIETLNQRIDSLNLSSTITLNKSTETLQKEMLISSIYVMSSKTECFPMVLLEAMSCGVPVVSFDCPNGPRNIISHNKDGILIDNGNNIALGNGILSLIKDTEKRKEMGHNAQTNVAKFSQDKIMLHWLSLFNYKKT
jgi:glycosyltransferase involved in cell wall biosynthesis